MINNYDKPIYRSLPRHLVEFLGQKEDITPNFAEYQKTPVLAEINASVNKTLAEIIIPYYDSMGLNCPMNNLAKFIRGPLENAHTHSDSEKPVQFGIYLSKNGLIASFNDGGEFFRNQKVQKSYKNRKIYHDRNIIRTGGLGNSNIQFVYDYADILDVDISKGTLYIGLGINKVTSAHWEKYKEEDTTTETSQKLHKNHKSQKVKR
jgi:hypothetical protein